MRKKKYHKKPIYYNTISVAINRAQKLREDARTQIQIVNHNALQHLLDGRAEKSHLIHLAAAINMSDALHMINLGRDYTALIADAKQCILRIYSAPNHTLSAEDKDILLQWIDLHDAQLDIASNDDILRSQDIINNHIKSGHVERVTAPAQNG
jgi:hypothetical protein